MAVSPLSLMTGNDPETYRQKLALMLAQGGLDASPIRSPWQGAARMAQALIAGMQFKDMKNEDSDSKYSDITDKLLGKKPATEPSFGPAPSLPEAPSAEAPQPSTIPATGGGPIDRMASISAAGETGNPDISAKLAQIANDTGGSKSYGPFGLNSWARGGDVGSTSIGKFAREHGGSLGLTATPGTPEFDAQWKAAAATNPDALKAANMAWYQKNIAGGVTPKLGQLGVPQEMASDPRVQGYFADRAIQYGPASVEKHAARLSQALSGANGDPAAFIRGMSAADRQNIPGDFRSYLATNPNNTPGLNNRISTRERMAMALNGGQLPANAQPTAGAFPSGPLGDVSGLGGNAPPQMTPFMPPPNMAQLQPPMPPQQAAMPPQAAPPTRAAPPVAGPPVAQQPTGPARTQLSLPPDVEERVRLLGSKRATFGKAMEILHEYSKPPSSQYEPMLDAQGNKIGIRDRVTGDEKSSPDSNPDMQKLRYLRQNAAELGLPDPKSTDPKAVEFWQTQAAKIGGGQSFNISQSADKTGAEKLTTESVAGYKDAMEGAKHANRSTTTYAQMAKAAESFMPGASANIRLDAQRWLKDSGIIKGENVPAGEQLRMLGGRLALESAPKGQGQVSNYERTMFKDALPQMTQSPEGFRQAVGMAQRLNEYDLAAARIWQEEARAAPHGVPDYRNVQDKLMALGPPLTSDEMASLQGLSGKEASGPQTPAPVRSPTQGANDTRTIGGKTYRRIGPQQWEELN